MLMHLYPREFHAQVKGFIFVFIAVCAVYFAFFPPSLFTRTMPIHVMIMAILLGYAAGYVGIQTMIRMIKEGIADRDPDALALMDEKIQFIDRLNRDLFELSKQHHGRIGVDSKTGQGSIFYFILPLADQPESGNSTVR
jgi:hypothetical protein